MAQTCDAAGSRGGQSRQTCEQLLAEVSQDLQQNILPFWIGMADVENGGFYGQVTHEGVLDKDAAKGGIYISRILWTFARAYRLLKEPAYAEAAEQALAFLIDHLWDTEFGGIYWSVDAQGRPLDTKKMFYVQAFSIYGLSEYARATGNENALERAKELYDLIEQHAYDPVHGGYFEGASRDWQTIEPMCLAPDEPPCYKSMNTHLHILEAYSNLLLVWPDEALREKQNNLLEVMSGRIVDPQRHHFKLFFDREWNSLNDHISYGHDIEGSWLLDEAAGILGEARQQGLRPLTVKMGETVYLEGLDENGVVQWEGDSSGVLDDQKYWWALSEQVVGFLNLYEMTGEERYLEVTVQAWSYIRDHLIDHGAGEWIWGRKADGTPIERDKAGIWKGPYHNGRMGFELIERLEKHVPLSGKV